MKNWILLCVAVIVGCGSKDDEPINSTGLEIYVSDIGNFEKGPWKIIKYDGNGENPKIFTDKNLGWPQDFYFLEDEDIVLITNFTIGNIARFDISTGEFKGNFATGLGGPTRMKLGPGGFLYVLQWLGNGKVFRYKLDGTFVDEFTSVAVKESIGLDWDAAGNLYVSSFNGGANGFVRKFDPSGNDLGLFIESGLQGPTNIWFDAEGNLIVNDWQGGSVKKFDPSGKLVGPFISGVSQPEGVDFLPDGNILIGSGGTSSVKMYNSNGGFIKNLVPQGSGGLRTPNAVAVRKIN